MPIITFGLGAGRGLEAQRHLGRDADHREGVRAFLEKRPPAFRGRR